jgi:NADPH:quinone reductase-like Zn-dependent oxidoreductase
MRAARVVRHGSPAEVIEVQDVAVPEPGAGEVRVAVAAASLNFGDIARCRGGVAAVMAEPPFTLGMDVAGVVEAAGDGMEHWLGRRVVGMCPQSLGGLADQALAGTVFDAPPELSDVEAAAFTLPFHVGYLALHERAQLQPGETVLVRGGAGAVGTAAIQLAVAAGARVIAVAGGPEKAQLCRDLGAERAIDQDAESVFDVVMDETADRGARRHLRPDRRRAHRDHVDLRCAGRPLPRGRLQRRPRVGPDRPSIAQAVDGQPVRDGRAPRLPGRAAGLPPARGQPVLAGYSADAAVTASSGRCGSTLAT